MKHCWASKAEVLEARGDLSAEWTDAMVNREVCMLPAGHDGEHEWTPTSEIVISFWPAQEKSQA